MSGGVLVAEDNPTNRFVICAMLKSMGIKPDIAEDGMAAVEAARRDRPRLILMDINMPKLNGMDAARKLADDPDTAGIPIVAVTATASDHQRRVCEEAGFKGFVPKPVDVAEFEAAVSPYLSAAA